jgi:hypothetical protein
MINNESNPIIYCYHNCVNVTNINDLDIIDKAFKSAKDLKIIDLLYKRFYQSD